MLITFYLCVLTFWRKCYWHLCVFFEMCLSRCFPRLKFEFSSNIKFCRFVSAVCKNLEFLNLSDYNYNKWNKVWSGGCYGTIMWFQHWLVSQWWLCMWWHAGSASSFSLIREIYGLSVLMFIQFICLFHNAFLSMINLDLLNLSA